MREEPASDAGGAVDAIFGRPDYPLSPRNLVRVIDFVEHHVDDGGCSVVASLRSFGESLVGARRHSGPGLRSGRFD